MTVEDFKKLGFDEKSFDKAASYLTKMQDERFSESMVAELAWELAEGNKEEAIQQLEHWIDCYKMGE